MPTFETLETEVNGAVGIITLNRPKALNAINTQMVEELGQALDAWKDLGLAAVILTGKGKAFAAGADISQMSSFTATEAQNFALIGQQTFRKLELFPAPTIAAVNGFALGGGCELAMCCDIILASPHAKFGQPEVNLGVIPGFGGTQRLVRRVGRQAALELMMTGRTVGAHEAVSLGIALRMEEDVVAAANTMARTIAKKGPVAVRLVKHIVDMTDRWDTNAGLVAEAKAFGECFATADQTEGMQAFLEKRTANFTGK
jgi:enoyl-CoA hydratase